jgi:hypothetical protein
MQGNRRVLEKLRQFLLASAQFVQRGDSFPT